MHSCIGVPLKNTSKQKELGKNLMWSLIVVLSYCVFQALQEWRKPEATLRSNGNRCFNVVQCTDLKRRKALTLNEPIINSNSHWSLRISEVSIKQKTVVSKYQKMGLYSKYKDNYYFWHINLFLCHNFQHQRDRNNSTFGFYYINHKLECFASILRVIILGRNKCTFD